VAGASQAFVPGRGPPPPAWRRLAAYAALTHSSMYETAGCGSACAGGCAVFPRFRFRRVQVEPCGACDVFSKASSSRGCRHDHRTKHGCPCAAAGCQERIVTDGLRQFVTALARATGTAWIAPTDELRRSSRFWTAFAWFSGGVPSRPAIRRGFLARPPVFRHTHCHDASPQHQLG
jgi:hypothetical protein